MDSLQFCPHRYKKQSIMPVNWCSPQKLPASTIASSQFIVPWKNCNIKKDCTIKKRGGEDRNKWYAEVTVEHTVQTICSGLFKFRRYNLSHKRTKNNHSKLHRIGWSTFTGRYKATINFSDVIDWNTKSQLWYNLIQEDILKLFLDSILERKIQKTRRQ